MSNNGFYHGDFFFEKIFGIFHIYYYLCSAVPVRPSPRLFDAGDDPGFFISFYLPHPQTFSKKSLLLSEEKRIFAEEKLHSAI